ncbi:MAG TPA: hypothetical protein VL501_03785 [Pyrinomonadaceae bacterium]|nr:hypothetical protein [Pyrinomonadaceae bacterium]
MTVLAGVAFSQTTIFNIPTADTLAKGSVNLEADYITHPVSHDKGGYHTLGYRFAIGATGSTELGSNFYWTWDGSEAAADIEFSLKQRLYSNDKNGVSVSAGGIAFVPLDDHTGDRTSVMVYGNVSKAIKPLGGMNVTVGGYHVFRGRNDFGTRTGIMLGLVQPMTNRVSFIADWFSGQNRFGYASAGVNVNLTKRQYATAGWSFGNSGRGNNALAVYYGVTF